MTTNTGKNGTFHAFVGVAAAWGSVSCFLPSVGPLDNFSYEYVGMWLISCYLLALGLPFLSSLDTKYIYRGVTTAGVSAFGLTFYRLMRYFLYYRHKSWGHESLAQAAVNFVLNWGGRPNFVPYTRLAASAVIAVTGILFLSQSTGGQPMKCPKCGDSDNEPDASYCDQCGAPLDSDAKAPPASSAELPTDPLGDLVRATETLQDYSRWFFWGGILSGILCVLMGQFTTALTTVFGALLASAMFRVGGQIVRGMREGLIHLAAIRASLSSRAS